VRHFLAFLFHNSIKCYKLISTSLTNLRFWLVNPLSDQTCWPGSPVMTWKTKIYFHSRKANVKVDFYQNGCIEFWFVFIHSSHITFHIYITVKMLLLPIILLSFIQSEVAWSSLNVNSKVVLLHWNTSFSLLFFVRPNWLHVKSNFVPSLTCDRLIEKKLFACLKSVELISH